MTLDLQNGILTRNILEEKFKNLFNLKSLALENEKLRKIEAGAFKGLNQIEELWLCDNKIEEIDPDVFADLSNLKYLTLSNNKLIKIEEGTFRGLNQLEQLYLQHNQIGEIKPGAFDGLSNLKILKLSNNKLSQLSRAMLRSLSSSVGYIDLSENNFAQATSFYDKSVLYKWSFSCSMIASVMFLGRNYKSDFDEFLSQFPDSDPSSESLSDSSASQESRLADREHDESMLDLIREVDPYINKELKERYLVEKALGEGAFGKVYLVTDQSTPQKKAMKMMDRDEIADNELNVLMRLDHVNVVKYYDHFEFNVECSRGQRKTKLAILTEFCEKGDLADQIKERQIKQEKFKEAEIFKWIFEATCGLKYLHSQRVIHRDIKPANILLTNDSVVKIGDLGVSKITESTIHAETFTGTRIYMSPELLRNEKYSYNTDVWSMGCVMFEMMYLKRAFTREQIDDVSKMTIPHLGDHILFSPILEKMLKISQSDRIDSNKLHDDLKKVADVLNYFKANRPLR